MCLPLCFEKMVQAVSRRDFFRKTGLGVAATTASAGPARAPGREHEKARVIQFDQVVDLTHTLTPDFPTWSGRPQMAIQTMSTLEKNGWNVCAWRIEEHTGTHLDAPFHKSNKDTAELIPAASLVGPLAVVDIRRKAAGEPDAELTLDDLKAWEAKHGPLPPGSIVAMCSGWDAHVRTARFRNADAGGTLHFPGFHAEAVDFLIADRDVKGIVVDTLSLDRGLAKDFPVHVRWLGSNRWGLECAANLGQLPAKGAALVVGGPKLAGASGGPSRVFAFV